MRTPDRLPDEALDSLLDGSPSEEAVGTPLAAYLDAVRHDAVSTDPQPSDELGVVLAEGLDPAEIEVGVQAAAAASGITAWRRRGRTAVRALVTKFAALGLLTKAAAAGAAVTVAASGAGAAGVLPPPAQSTFNEVIGREAPSEDADDETGESAPETPADTSSTAPLDSDLSDDATGASDDDPGVDGSGVAEDASDEQGNVPDHAPDRTEDVPEEPPAEDAPDGTPAEDVVEDTPGEDARPESDEADDGQDAAGNGEVDPRPDDPTQPPWDAEQPPR